MYLFLSNGAKSSSFSPVPTKRVGIPRSSWIVTTMPPLPLPSSLVTIKPVSPSAFVTRVPDLARYCRCLHRRRATSLAVCPHRVWPERVLFSADRPSDLLSCVAGLLCHTAKTRSSLSLLLETLRNKAPRDLRRAGRERFQRRVFLPRYRVAR